MTTGEQINSIVYKVFYYFITGVLLFSGVAKIIDPMPMIETLNAAKLTGEQLNILLASILPIIEIILGLFMIFKQYLNTTLLLVTVLFTLFLTFTIYGNVIGLNEDCGCFGTLISSEFNIEMVLRNIMLVVIVSVLFYLSNYSQVRNAK